MNKKSTITLGFPHLPQPHGGPGSFQIRLSKEIQKKGWNICYPEDNQKPDAILVVGGTKKLKWLWKMKKAGVPIIYRLDGKNWLHLKKNLGLKIFYINEIRNLLMQIIRSFFASHIIYQSEFVENWWIKKGWRTNAKKHIIHNGVNLKQFTPLNGLEREAKIDLLIVEGTVDYSPYAVDLLNGLQKELIEKSYFNSLKIFGKFKVKEEQQRLEKGIRYEGYVDRKDLPSIYKDAIYLSLDVNAACPNTVIEALSSGIPVVGYDTGALKELVPDEVGSVVGYGGNPWKLDTPNLDNLIKGALKVLNNWEEYSKNARLYAEKHYDIGDVTGKYIEIIEKASSKKII